MSTLKTNNLEHLDSSSPNVTLGVGGGINVVGVLTASSDVVVGVNTSSGLILSDSSGQQYRVSVNTDGTLFTVSI